MERDFFDKVNDKELLQNHLAFCGAFIMAYDNFVSTWEQGIYFLYENCKTAIINGDDKFNVSKTFVRVEWQKFEDYKKNNDLKCFIECEYKSLKRKYNAKTGNPMFLWMSEHQFIEPKDVCILEKSRVCRNTYAHNLDNTLKHRITQDEKDLLKSLIDISERASQMWVYKVAIPSHSNNQHLIEYFDSDGNKIEPRPENLLTGTSIFYSLVLSNLDNIL